MFVGNWIAVVTISVAVLLAATLVRLIAPRKRERVRRVTMAWLAYLAALAFATVAGGLSFTEASRVGMTVAAALAWVTIIDVSALIVFELALPKLGFELPSIIGDLAIGAAFFVLIVAGMRRMGVDPTSIVATSAVVTGILALSLQPTLGNVIGGVALQLDRSVRVGDWLQLDSGKQGRVREIRWRHTVIETRDWDTIIVPNSSLLAANIIILGKREGAPVQHRMWVYFTVDFRYRPVDVITPVEKALRSKPWLEGVAEDPPPNCICYDFARDGRDSVSLYAVRYWLTDLARDDPTSSKVRERIYAALKRAEIPLAIPAAHLFISEENKKRLERKRKRNLDERLAALRAVEFLEVLTPEEMESVADGLRPAPYAAGETITRQGAEGHWLYVLADGEVDVLVSAGNQENRVATLNAPTFFGEMSLMTGEPRGATVIARTDALCYRLDRDDFRRILRERPAVAQEISSLLAARDVELQSARDHLDAKAKKARVGAESTRLLGRIQDFFGLSTDGD